LPPVASAKPFRNWYRISVDAVRGWLGLLLVLGLGVAGFYGYVTWMRGALEREVDELLSEGAALRTQVESLGSQGTFRGEYQVARSAIEQARQLREQENFQAAIEPARQGRDLLLGVLDALGARGIVADAKFLSVSGDVQYRRGGRGNWETARGGVTLRAGDFVKTAGDGAAQLVFGDGKLCTVRPRTLIVVSSATGGGGAPGAGQAIQMEYGWVNLNTAQSSGHIVTPSASALVRERSEASVSYDRGSKTGRFAALRGLIELTAGGVRREVREKEEVVQERDRFSAARPLLAAPQLLEPSANQSFTLGQRREVVLSWEPVAGSAHYVLQASRAGDFINLVVEDENRTSTRATLGLRGEGVFYWRVAAVSRDGAPGAWSPERTFRVAPEQLGDADRTPPILQLESIRPYGSLVIVSGRSEPGVTLFVNGEASSVEADGTFSKTVQFLREGWNSIEVRATDAWGNEAARRRRVFIES
jgi:hypothetical protein